MIEAVGSQVTSKQAIQHTTVEGDKLLARLQRVHPLPAVLTQPLRRGRGRQVNPRGRLRVVGVVFNGRLYQVDELIGA